MSVISIHSAVDWTSSGRVASAATKEKLVVSEVAATLWKSRYQGTNFCQDLETFPRKAWQKFVHWYLLFHHVAKCKTLFEHYHNKGSLATSFLQVQSFIVRLIDTHLMIQGSGHPQCSSKHTHCTSVDPLPDLTQFRFFPIPDLHFCLFLS